MRPGAAAEARHRAYALFGRVFVEGLTTETVATLRSLPAVADVVPEPFDADRTAAAHHDALGRQVFPYESAFRSADGQLGGPVGAAVHAAYRAGGFAPQTASTEPDHIGLQLAYLAHLARAEAEAADDGRVDVVERCVAHTARFLDQHALLWWPSFAGALATQADTAWLARVGALAAELAEGHRAGLDVAVAPPVDQSCAPLDLDDPETRLKDIVEHLVRPARCGVFLSQRGMDRAAVVTGLPTGFGPRPKRLEALWHTAADHHAVEALAIALRAEVDGVVAAWGGAVQPADRDRIDRTREVLQSIARAAG